MAKRKNKGKSWGVFFITMGFIVLQLLNIFFSMAYSEAFYVAFTGKSTINTNVNFEGMPEPGSVALFFPLYTLMRTFGYKVCHWLGYHADAEHAYHEGEGDRSLSYWREVHEKFFKSEYAQMGKQFHEKIPCVCEVFKVVYDGAN